MAKSEDGPSDAEMYRSLAVHEEGKLGIQSWFTPKETFEWLYGQREIAEPGVWDLSADIALREAYQRRNISLESVSDMSVTDAASPESPEITAPDDLNSWEPTTVGEHIVFIRIVPDSDSENPLKDWSAMGIMHSRNRRHENFDADAVMDALENNKDAVALSYFEHGSWVWGVQGELGKIPGVEFQWDGVEFAGAWVPDKDTLDEAKEMKLAEGSPERRAFMVARATSTCAAYTQWGNGDVYGYQVETYGVLKDDDGEPLEEHQDYRNADALQEDSCYGFYGSDDVKTEALSVAKSQIAALAPAAPKLAEPEPSLSVKPPSGPKL